MLTRERDFSQTDSPRNPKKQRTARAGSSSAKAWERLDAPTPKKTKNLNFYVDTRARFFVNPFFQRQNFTLKP
jgi:hypothetical protein